MGLILPLGPGIAASFGITPEQVRLLKESYERQFGPSVKVRFGSIDIPIQEPTGKRKIKLRD